MQEMKKRIKEHIFVCIISLTILIGCIVLTIYFSKYNEATPSTIIGFVLLYLWIPSILPAGYYYFRALVNSLYQRQPKFIFSDFFHLSISDGIFIILAPILVPNYIWLLIVDIQSYKRKEEWESQK